MSNDAPASPGHAGLAELIEDMEQETPPGNSFVPSSTVRGWIERLRRPGHAGGERERYGWHVVKAVTCVECPYCGFTMDATHTDADEEHYSCPNCDHGADAPAPSEDALLRRLQEQIDRARQLADAADDEEERAYHEGRANGLGEACSTLRATHSASRYIEGDVVVTVCPAPAVEGERRIEGWANKDGSAWIRAYGPSDGLNAANPNLVRAELILRPTKEETSE